MRVKPLMLKKLMKIAKYKTDVDTISFDDSQKVKKYFESLKIEGDRKISAFRMKNKKVVIATYSCNVENCIDYIQEITSSEIDIVYPMTEEVLNLEPIYIDINYYEE